MVRISTHNVNGIRAASRRGYRAWVDANGLDVICLQEVRSPEALIPLEAFDGFHVAYHEGDRAGRNGVAVLSREAPSEVRVGFGVEEFDVQGRYVEVDLPAVTVASLYLPKGDVYGPKFEFKQRFMAAFSTYLEQASERAEKTGRGFVVCGDYNIAHTEADIKAWKANLKSDGFLPEERSWYGQQISGTEGAAGGPMVDVLRTQHQGVAGPYSWWSWRGKAFDNDAGWRIDHHWATPALAAVAQEAKVDRAASYAERISDHAPVTVDYHV